MKALIVGLALLVSGCAATGKPGDQVDLSDLTFIQATQYGFLFTVNGKAWMCRTDGGGQVSCEDEDGKPYECTFALKENGYFHSCREAVGI